MPETITALTTPCPLRSNADKRHAVLALLHDPAWHQRSNRAIARKCAAFTKELAGPQPSPLERLLVERIAMCWLHLSYAEALYAQNIQVLSCQQAEHYERRLSKAQARYLSAIRTLAQVRRLGVPAVQVNIGQQQVIAG
jgi:hypothetical protein